jgi:hypothetical protein
MVSGFVRFLTYWYLSGKVAKLDAFIAQIIAHSPFLQAFNQHHF